MNSFLNYLFSSCSCVYLKASGISNDNLVKLWKSHQKLNYCSWCKRSRRRIWNGAFGSKYRIRIPAIYLSQSKGLYQLLATAAATLHSIKFHRPPGPSGRGTARSMLTIIKHNHIKYAAMLVYYAQRLVLRGFRSVVPAKHALDLWKRG